MQVTHLSNSFLTVATARQFLVCDPWVGMANHGGWHSLPEYAPQALHAAVAPATLVYISHLHSDHFDPDFLQAAGLLDRHFVIKRFDNGVLRRRLQALGVQQITELEPFTATRFGDLQLAIVPQMTSNSSGLDDAVDYDLDTSLVVGDGTHTFFNQVDNPLSLADFGAVKRFIDAEFGAIDLACLVAGAAGEYPQCFLGIDRAAEARRIVAGALVQLQAQVQRLQPRWVFPAGGTYFIPGALHALNAHIAQPDHAQFAQAVLDSGAGLPLVLEGGWSVDLGAAGAGGTATPQRRVQALPRSRADSMAAHAADLYPHQQPAALAQRLDDAALAALLDRAAQQHHQTLQRRGLVLDSDIVFAVHEALCVDAALNLASTPSLQFSLPARAEGAARLRLTVHIDRLALQRCLQRQANWNQTLSGSLCLFERTPNVFDPSAVFSLNFLVA